MVSEVLSSELRPRRVHTGQRLETRSSRSMLFFTQVNSRTISNLSFAATVKNDSSNSFGPTIVFESLYAGGQGGRPGKLPWLSPGDYIALRTTFIPA
jgi:hypothetical protein